MLALKHERRMNLIIENTHVILCRKIAQTQLLLQGEHFADRVVRVAEHERMASGRKRAFDGVEVEHPLRLSGFGVAALQHFDFDHVNVVQFRNAQKRHVGRRRHDHAVARTDQFTQENLISFEYVGNHANNARIDIPSVMRALPSCACCCHALFPGFGNVAEFAMVAGVVDGFLDAGSQAVVHFGDERADAAGVACPLVGADCGKIGCGGVVDGVGVKAGTGTMLHFHDFFHGSSMTYRCLHEQCVLVLKAKTVMKFSYIRCFCYSIINLIMTI